MNFYNNCNTASKANTIEVGATVLLILHAVTTLFQPPINFVVLSVCFVGCIFNMFSLYKFLSADDRIIINSVLAIFFIKISYVIIGLSDYELISSFTFNLISWCLTITASVYFLRFCNYKQVCFIGVVILCSLFLRAYQCYTLGSYLILTASEDEAALVDTAKVSSAYMLFSAICFIYFLHSKIRWTRIVAITIILLTIYVNFFILQRATNVIFTMAAFGMVLVFNFRQNAILKVLLILICIALFVVFSTDLYIPLLDGLASIMPDRVASRIYEISLALQYEDINASSGSLSGRNRLLTQSLLTFVSSPLHFLFGAGEHPGPNALIGNHSYFLDTLARYGLIGGVITFINFKGQYIFLKSFVDKEFNHRLFNQTMVVFAFYLLRNFYGNLNFDFSVTVMILLLPIMLILLNHQKQNI